MHIIITDNIIVVMDRDVLRVKLTSVEFFLLKMVFDSCEINAPSKRFSIV